MDAQSYSRAASAVELDEVAENIPVTASVVYD